MATPRAFLPQLRIFLAEYLKAAQSDHQARMDETNAELRQVIAELQDIQKHPEQRTRLESLGDMLLDRAQRLETHSDTQPSGAAVTALALAFERYIDDVDAYLDRTGEPSREQLVLLIGDLVPDLRLLALHHDDEQLHSLASGIDEKRAQLLSSQRPWQTAPVAGGDRQAAADSTPP